MDTSSDFEEPVPGPSGTRETDGNESELPVPPPSPNHPTVAQIIPFKNFSQLLEVISDAKIPDKIKKLGKYVDAFRTKFMEIHKTMDPKQAHGDSIFSLIRLLCPNRDRERASYGIKSSVLGRIFVKVLSIDKDTPDGKQLLEFTNPAIVEKSAGDLPHIIYKILLKRIGSRGETHDGPTIHQLNYALDQIARTDGTEVTQDKQVKILRSIVRNMSPIEGKWLARIILKKVDIGLSETQILNLIHKDARDLLITTGLEEVCLALNDPTVVVMATISLFSFFRPMLCERLNLAEDPTGPEGTLKIVGYKGLRSRKQPLQLPPPPFIIETKWDGERFQIHYEFNESTGQEVFKYYSRNGFDFTKAFNETFTPRLKEQLVKSPRVTSFILDGEMMAWNYSQQAFTQKGQSIDVKRLRLDNKNHCPAFVIYDLLYLNGVVLSQKELQIRIKFIEKVVVPKESVVYISEKRFGNTLEDVVKELDAAIDNSDEGIIIKEKKAFYLPGRRIPQWLKLKPEYVDSCKIEDMDLLILGGNYSDTRRRGGKITSLLLGVIDNEDYYPLTLVGCGKLKHPELEALIATLQPYFTDIEIPGVKYKGRKRPDLFIDPANSVVLQVTASEILYNKDYALNYSLRFPVVTKIRKDKPWSEAMTVDQFHDIRVATRGKLVKKTQQGTQVDDTAAKIKVENVEPKTLTDSSSSSKKNYFNHNIDFRSDSESDSESKYTKRTCENKQRAGKKRTNHDNDSGPTEASNKLSPNKTLARLIAKLTPEPNTMTTSTTSSIFTSKVFLLIGSAEWKEKLEKLIKEHGGEVVKNITRDTSCIIAEKASKAVNQRIIHGGADILKPEWIYRCIKLQKSVDYEPRDFIFAKTSTKEWLERCYDKFGDNYFKKLDLSSTRKMICRIIHDHVVQEEENKEADRKSLSEIRNELSKDVFLKISHKLKKKYFLSGCTIAFRGGYDPVLKSSIPFYGGRYVESELVSGITHIVDFGQHATKAVTTRNPRKAEPFILTKYWLEDCLKKYVRLDESNYLSV